MQTRGSGPYGRVIERDVLAYTNSHEPLTPAAREQLGGNLPPAVGSGVGGKGNRTGYTRSS